jgi:hypothetical protein
MFQAQLRLQDEIMREMPRNGSQPILGEGRSRFGTICSPTIFSLTVRRLVQSIAKFMRF